MRQFANWWLLRRASSHPRARLYTSAAAGGIRERVTIALAFVAWLDQHGVQLPQITQLHVDGWLADGPAARHTLRPFI